MSGSRTDYLGVRQPEEPEVMERVNITIGSLRFDQGNYDAEKDVRHEPISQPYFSLPLRVDYDDQCAVALSR